MWKQFIDSIFPVNIDRKLDLLLIEDRRPSNSLLFSAALAAGALLVSALLFRPFVTSGIYWPLILLLPVILVFGIRSLLLSFRETYVFNKDQAVYTFTRQGILKRRTTEGDLSQIRAVQMERKSIATEHGTREVFRVVLLQWQGLLLGASDGMVLREEAPMNSYYENEARIAIAIAGFLDLPVPEIVDV